MMMLLVVAVVVAAAEGEQDQEAGEGEVGTWTEDNIFFPFLRMVNWLHDLDG